MQAMDLMRKGDLILRILKIKEERVLVIDCLKRTMPIWTPVEELDGYDEIEEEELYKATGFVPVDIEKLDAERRRIAFQRFTLIMGILPRVDDDMERNYAISSAAEFFGKSKETVRVHLCRYLVFQSISALAPLKREHEEILSEDQKNMRWALNKFFYTTKRYPLSLAYTLMLKEKYCDAEGKLIPDHPSIHQFRYFYKTHRKMQNLLISRNGLTDYQRNSRPLLGDGVQEFAPAPGTAMLTVFGAMAELERESILERQREGIAIAKAEGKYKGRQPLQVDEQRLRTVCQRWRAGEITAKEAMQLLELKPNTFYRRVKEHGL